MTGKHFGWHKKWVLDADANRATHANGLITRFIPLDPDKSVDWPPIHDNEFYIGVCWTDGGIRWGVAADKDLYEAAVLELISKHGKHNATQMAARLANEAGKVWIFHQQNGD